MKVWEKGCFPWGGEGGREKVWTPLGKILQVVAVCYRLCGRRMDLDIIDKRESLWVDVGVQCYYLSFKLFNPLSSLARTSC